MNDISSNIQNMHQYFYTRKTYDVDFRLYFLKKLKKAITANQNQIISALYRDFKKPVFETYITEIYSVLSELNFTINNLKKWAKPFQKNNTFPLLSSKLKVIPEPYGVVLIFVPFNYPFQLALSPLIGALAAGNCVGLKLSEYTPNTNKVLKKIIHTVFHRNYVCTFEGDGTLCNKLLEEPIDYIFFTGGTINARSVMKKAAEHLIPVTLELGGKSPAIVDYDADISLAAKRIIWGKFLNAGQTCIAPDYVLVHEQVAEDLLNEMVSTIQKFYRNKQDMASIINENHYARLIKCINKDKIYYGGSFDTKQLYISPTILYPACIHDECMKEEIFGPILPVIKFNKLSKAINIIQSYPKPLSCYIFGYNKLRIDHMLKHLSFGGGCINDTILHVSTPYAPFGGIGYSGMGSYHGYHSFKTFSHYKSILYSGAFELPFRYPPYGKKTNIIRQFINNNTGGNE